MMKKILLIVSVILACLTLTACNTSDKDRFSGVEWVRVDVDRIGLFDDLKSLEEYCGIAVVGKFIDDPVQ